MSIKSPFKFLDAYTLADKDIFFGRQEECDALYDMVSRNKLILVYGQSGTGKTSLVQCGLASRFDATDWFPVFVRRRSNINTSLKEALGNALELPHPVEDVQEAIQEIYAQYLRPVYLLFDQMEELFVIPEANDQTTFFQEIAGLVRGKTPCRILFIIREEYLAHLYQYESVIPTLFDRRLRVEIMNYEKVSHVISQSCREFNISFEEEGVNIRQIIEAVSGGKPGVSLPYLQIYLDGLYRNDYRLTYPDGNTDTLPPLSFATKEIKDFGDINKVMKSFLKEQEEQTERALRTPFPEVQEGTVRRILDIFATPEGTKRPIPFSTDNGQVKLNQKLAGKIADLPLLLVENCLSMLANARILRISDDAYELAHDSLALLIDQNRSDEERKLNEIKVRIVNSYHEKQQTGEFLSHRQLLSMEEYLPKLELEPVYAHFIDDSYAEVERISRMEQERQAAELEKERTLRGEAEVNAKRARNFSYVASLLALAATVLTLYVQQLNVRSHETTAESYIKDENFSKAVESFIKAKRFAFLRQPYFDTRIEETRQKKAIADRYYKYMSKGDSLHNQGPYYYPQALIAYDNAVGLNYKPEAQQKAQSLQGDIRRAFERYKEQGRVFYNAKGYQDAIWAFQMADLLLPGDPYVKQRLADLQRE